MIIYKTGFILLLLVIAYMVALSIGWCTFGVSLWGYKYYKLDFIEGYD